MYVLATVGEVTALHERSSWLAVAPVTVTDVGAVIEQTTPGAPAEQGLLHEFVDLTKHVYEPALRPDTATGEDETGGAGE